MKKLLSILLLFASFGVYAQTLPSVPAGAKTYGTQPYLLNDGNILMGTSALKYRVVPTKARVDSLFLLKVSVSPSSPQLGSIDMQGAITSRSQLVSNGNLVVDGSANINGNGIYLPGVNSSFTTSEFATTNVNASGNITSGGLTVNDSTNPRINLNNATSGYTLSNSSDNLFRINGDFGNSELLAIKQDGSIIIPQQPQLDGSATQVLLRGPNGDIRRKALSDFALSSGGSGYIQNNNTGTPQAASANIDGQFRIDNANGTTLFAAGLGSYSTALGSTLINGGNVDAKKITAGMTSTNAGIEMGNFGSASIAYIHSKTSSGADRGLNILGSAINLQSPTSINNTFSANGITTFGQGFTSNGLGTFNTGFKTANNPNYFVGSASLDFAKDNTYVDNIKVKAPSEFTGYHEQQLQAATGTIALTSDVSALVAQKGQANGFASLDANGKLLNSQVPALALVDTYVVTSQSAMLALPAEQGDVAIRNDEIKTYILQSNPATLLANWVPLKTPQSPVESVNGQTGIVSLSKTDIGLGNVDNTSDASKPVSTATQTALNNKLGLTGGTMTGSINASGIDNYGATKIRGSFDGVDAVNFNVPTYTTTTNNNAVASTKFVQDRLASGQSIGASASKWNGESFNAGLNSNPGTLMAYDNTNNQWRPTNQSQITAGSATLWNGRIWQGAQINAPAYFMTSPDAGNWHYSNVEQAKTALGINNGSTLNNIAANSIQWNGQENDFSTYGTSLDYLVGKDITTNKTKPFNPTQIKSFLATSFDNVMGVNPTTTITPYFDSGQVFVRFTPIDRKIEIGANAIQASKISDNSASDFYLNYLGGNVGIGTTSPTVKLDVAGDIKANNLISGTYTPTVTLGTSLTSSTAHTCHYTRVGNEVTVHGWVEVTAASLSGNTNYSITLPIASNMTSADDLSGVGQYISSGQGTTRVVGDGSADKAIITVAVQAGVPLPSYFSFTYTIK